MKNILCWNGALNWRINLWNPLLWLILLFVFISHSCPIVTLLRLRSVQAACPNHCLTSTALSMSECPIVWTLVREEPPQPNEAVALFGIPTLKKGGECVTQHTGFPHYKGRVGLWGGKIGFLWLCVFRAITDRMLVMMYLFSEPHSALSKGEGEVEWALLIVTPVTNWLNCLDTSRLFTGPYYRLAPVDVTVVP